MTEFKKRNYTAVGFYFRQFFVDFHVKTFSPNLAKMSFVKDVSSVHHDGHHPSSRQLSILMDIVHLGGHCPSSWTLSILMDIVLHEGHSDQIQTWGYGSYLWDPYLLHDPVFLTLFTLVDIVHLAGHCPSRWTDSWPKVHTLNMA